MSRFILSIAARVRSSRVCQVRGSYLAVAYYSLQIMAANAACYATIYAFEPNLWQVATVIAHTLSRSTPPLGFPKHACHTILAFEPNHPGLALRLVARHSSAAGLRGLLTDARGGAICFLLVCPSSMQKSFSAAFFLKWVVTKATPALGLETPRMSHPLHKSIKDFFVD